jgi:hypothetical protein
VTEGNSSDCFSLASSALVRTGVFSLTRWQLSGSGLQQIPLAADGGFRRGDDRLPNGVDGRVRHLGKQLLEVVVQQLAAC